MRRLSDTTVPRATTAFRVRAAMLVAILAIAAACRETTVDDEPQVSKVELTFVSTTGTQVKTFANTQGEVREVTLPLGTTTVTARWLKADGTVETRAEAGEFRLNVDVTGATGITFTQGATNLFSGSLIIGSAVTNAKVKFQLFHIAEGHGDFESEVTINSQ